MKKLALALVCLVSVAFFASCTPEVTNPEPSIAIVTGDNYVYDGQTIDLYQEYLIGFRTASNSQTVKELATFRLETKVYEGTDESRPTVYDTTYTISGTEFVFDDVVYFELATKDLVGKVEYTATVTDVAGKFNSATVTLNLNLAEQPLTEVDFEWYRLGNTQTGLAEYGLKWEMNAKSPFAQIKPLEGVILYKFESSVWNEVTFESEKIAKFSDGATTALVYNNVDVNPEASTYDDVIGTRTTDGVFHLIHVTSARVGAQQNAGRPCYIYGKAK
jgi:hypothetical protein